MEPEDAEVCELGAVDGRDCCCARLANVARAAAMAAASPPTLAPPAGVLGARARVGTRSRGDGEGDGEARGEPTEDAEDPARGREAMACCAVAMAPADAPLAACICCCCWTARAAAAACATSSARDVVLPLTARDPSAGMRAATAAPAGVVVCGLVGTMPRPTLRERLRAAASAATLRWLV